MKKLLIGTANPGKFREFSKYLTPNFACASLRDMKLAIPEVEETGATYHENVLIKAQAYWKVFGIPTLADDSGLEVDLLNGEPGVHSARFGGDISWPEKWELLLSKLKDLPPDQWTARFRCVLCYFDGSPKYFDGTVEGILVSPKGEAGFGYDPIFYCPELKKTFGEATDEEKQRVSHRGAAVRKFLGAI